MTLTSVSREASHALWYAVSLIDENESSGIAVSLVTHYIFPGEMDSSLIDYWVFLDIQRLYGEHGESAVFRMAWLVTDRRAQVLDAKQIYIRPSLPTLRHRMRALLQLSDQSAERIVEALESNTDVRDGNPVLISNDIAVMYNLLDGMDELVAYTRQAFVQYQRRFGMVLPNKGSLMQLVADLFQQARPGQNSAVRNAVELVFGEFHLCDVQANASAGVFSRCGDMLTRFMREGGISPPERLVLSAGALLGTPRNGFSVSAPMPRTSLTTAPASWHGAPISAQSVAMGIATQPGELGNQRNRIDASSPYPVSGSPGTMNAPTIAPATPVPTADAVVASAVAPATPMGSVVRLRGLPWSATTRDVAEWIRQPPSKAAASADTSLLEDFVRRPLQILPGGIVFVYNHQGRKTGEVFVQFASPEDASRCLHKHEDRMGHRYIEVFLSSHQDMWNLLSRYEAKRAALGLGTAGSTTTTGRNSLRNGTRPELDTRSISANMPLPSSSVAMGIPIRTASNWSYGESVLRTESLSRSPPGGSMLAAHPASGLISRDSSTHLTSPAYSPCLRLSGADRGITERDVQRFIAPFQLDTTKGSTILACFVEHGFQVPPNTTIPPVHLVRTAEGQPSGEFTLVFQSVPERDAALHKSGQVLGTSPVTLSAISSFELAAALGILGITKNSA